MKFQPKSEDEIQRELLLPAGSYDFQVADAEEKTSKSGNPMIAVKLQVFDGDGGHRFVMDYLMEKMAFKFRHFCDSTASLDLYNSGSLTAKDCVGRCGKVKLAVEEQEGYNPKNTVKDYVKHDESADGLVPAMPLKSTVLKAAANNQDDQIPF